jgi:prepilin-type N-terminal cleavage/methylation domain-containing protein
MKTFFGKKIPPPTPPKLGGESSGFSLVEVIVAITIITLSLIAIMDLAQKSITVSRQSLHSLEAATLLEEGGEAVKTIRDGAWSNITSLTSGSTYYLSYYSGAWNLSGTPNVVDIFTRTITINSVNRDSNDDIATSGTNDTATKKVTVTVSWQEGGDTVSKTLTFYISNIFS